MTWVAAGVASGAATMAAVQYVKGKRDQKKDEKNRPKYHMPDEIRKNQSLAEQQALDGLPDEQVNEYNSNLERGSAYGLKELGDRSSGIAGVGTINQNMNDGYFNLMSADAAAKKQNLGVLMDQNQNVANYHDQEWQLNTLNPYYEGIARKQARNAALFQNLNNAGGMMGGAMGGKSAAGGGGASNAAPTSTPQVRSYTTPNPYANQQELNLDTNGANYMYGGQ